MRLLESMRASRSVTRRVSPLRRAEPPAQHKCQHAESDAEHEPEPGRRRGGQRCRLAEIYPRGCVRGAGRRRRSGILRTTLRCGVAAIGAPRQFGRIVGRWRGAWGDRIEALRPCRSRGRDGALLVPSRAPCVRRRRRSRCRGLRPDWERSRHKRDNENEQRGSACKSGDRPKGRDPKWNRHPRHE